MIDEPWFWRERTPLASFLSASLSPLAAAYDASQRWRAARTKPFDARAPVICIGNATLGGSGKTPCAIMLGAMMAEEGVFASFQTRGYGGGAKGPLLVDPSLHDANYVGDEALLLSRHGSVWIAKKRAAGIRAADAATRDNHVIIMDDGFQNPTVAKTLSILLIDQGDALGNGKVFPAGPLREPLARAVERADVVINVGNERDALNTDKPYFHAKIEPSNPPPPQKVVAFCGIARPARFFTLLTTLGFETVKQVAFPDHHRFRNAELIQLARLAEKAGAALLTTEKDHVRLPASFQKKCLTLSVAMSIDDKPQFKALLRRAVRSGALNHNRDGAS